MSRFCSASSFLFHVQFAGPDYTQWVSRERESVRERERELEGGREGGREGGERVRERGRERERVRESKSRVR